MRTQVRGLTLVLLSMAASAWAADGTLWGPVQSGLQLGIDYASMPEPALRVLLKNAGAETRYLVVGSETSVGAVYNIEFTALQQPVFDLRALKVPQAQLRARQSQRISRPARFAISRTRSVS